MTVYDTIIVGMGAAGCTAASVLCQAGKRVLALEAQDRVGGRVNTVAFGDGVVELGAEWIHGEVNSRVYELATSNNVSVLPQDVSFQVFRSDGTDIDSNLVNEFVNVMLEAVDDPPEIPEPLGQYLTRRIMDYMNTNYPELLKDKDFIEQLLHFLDLVIDNYEASNSWNDISTYTKYEDLGGNLHMSWHKHGYKTLFEILLNTYKGGPGYPTLDLKLQKVVTKISYPSDPSLHVEVSCEDGSVYKARNVIVTVSLGVLKESHATLFAPMLPQSKISTIDNMSMGIIGKIILLFPNRWLGNTTEDAYDFSWTAVDKKGLEGDWASDIGGATASMSNRNAVTLWTRGDIAKLVSIGPNIWVNLYGHKTLFSPPLPTTKVDTINHMSMGYAGKIVLKFDEIWWNPKFASSEFFWTIVDKKNLPSEDKWLTKVEGLSLTMGLNSTVCLWTSGETTKLVETLPEDVVKRKSMELIRRFMGKNVTIPEPVDMLRSTWYSNPYTRGSYTYDNVLTPLHPNAREILAAPLLDSSSAPRVLFAGEATDSKHFSTVHGATDTGHREASRLLPKGKL